MFVFEQLIVFYPELVRELNFLWLFSEHFHIISTRFVPIPWFFSNTFCVIVSLCSPATYREEKLACDEFKRQVFPFPWRLHSARHPHLRKAAGTQQLPRGWRDWVFSHKIKMERKILTVKEFQIINSICPIARVLLRS